MILLKNLTRTGNTFICVSRHYKIQSSHIHCFHSRYNLLKVNNAALAPEISHIISRFESSQVTSKDKILNLPNDTKPVSSTSPPAGDSLPDIQFAASPESTPASDIPEIIAEAAVPLNKLGEPTLQSLNLGNYYTPVGWVQNTLEFFHCTFGLPWWASISICVVIVRLAMFPLVIKQQRNSIKMHNAMPGMMDIQMRLQNARTYGNDIEAMKAGSELATYMKKHDINAASNFVMPMIQAPIFVSFFMGLRAMANTPVESMSRGGMLWFMDLTVQDQFYILPTLTCATLFVIIQVGADFSKMPSGSSLGRYMPTVLKMLPLLVFPFIMHFPAACTVYWATNNIVSLAQVLILRAPGVRDYFGISQKQKIKPPESVLGQRKGVVKDFKSTMGNMKIAKEIAERARLDEMAFRRAGRMPPAKTFKENPLKASAQAQKQ